MTNHRRNTTALAAILLAAGALTSTACHYQGGPRYSADRFTYESSSWYPKTVSLIDTRTGQTVWTVDIPVGEQLVVGFSRGTGPNEFNTDEIVWGLMPAGQRFGTRDFSQFKGADMIARKHGFNRETLDRYALESHRRALAATESGAFEDEIVPLAIEGGMHSRDEGIRADASYEGIAGVKLLEEGGVISAANASQICDGAAGVLVVSEAALKRHGLTPKARIVNLTVTAGDPVIMLEEPLPATEKALKRAGMTLAEIDLYEVNEAFASVPLAWLKVLGADPEKLNVNGGAIALGHPLGASGARLMTTLVHALHARGLKYGLQTMCEGGGIANVTIVEAL